jgi:hypothetical protein
MQEEPLMRTQYHISFTVPPTVFNSGFFTDDVQEFCFGILLIDRNSVNLWEFL